MRQRSTVLLLLLLVACQSMASGERAAGCGWTPDPEIHGAHLDNECDSRPWCQRADLKPRIRHLIEVAADHWGESPDILYGWKVRLVDDEWITCYGYRANGCTDWLTLTITLAAPRWDCIEQTALFHEVGHTTVAFGDAGHWGPMWWDNEKFARLYAEAVEPYAVVDNCWRDGYSNHWVP